MYETDKMPLARPNPALESTRRIIREAFEDLGATMSPADSRDLEATTIESVQKAARDIENQLAARSSLRNMRRLMPLFSGLEHYSKSIEVACNGTPYLPWLWAPIKLILKVGLSSPNILLFSKAARGFVNVPHNIDRIRLCGVV